MKIIRFICQNSTHVKFGAVVGDRAIAFLDIQNKINKTVGYFENSSTYLHHLPESENLAKKLFEWSSCNLDAFSTNQKPFLKDVKLLEPIEVKALFDFGLTPKHLENAGKTLIKYESKHPEIMDMLKAFGSSLSTESNNLSYYKCNMNSIVGTDEHVPWPLYTSRLDIEPELAVVYGNVKQPIAGYCIFNDISARDVQALEVVGGFCRTKDMPNGNQLGPYLVTQDEIVNPYQKAVSVQVNGKVKFQGSTSGISHKAEDVFEWMEQSICQLKPGSIIGLGTIPDCTGLDHDDFLNPGDCIEITMDNLGTLKCYFDKPVGKLSPSRWPLRSELETYV